MPVGGFGLSVPPELSDEEGLLPDGLPEEAPPDEELPPDELLSGFELSEELPELSGSELSGSSGSDGSETGGFVLLL